MALLQRRSQKIEVLKTVPLFQGLTRRQLDEIAKHVDEVSVPEGRTLTREGEVGREFFVILEGRTVVRRRDRKIAELGEGDFFGEMSLIEAAERSATVQAETDAVLLVIHRREFTPLLDSVPGLGRNLLVGLSRRLREADQRLVG